MCLAVVAVIVVVVIIMVWLFLVLLSLVLSITVVLKLALPLLVTVVNAHCSSSLFDTALCCRYSAHLRVQYESAWQAFLSKHYYNPPVHKACMTVTQIPVGDACV